MPDNILFTNIADLQQLLKGAANSQAMAILNNVMAETIGMSMHNAVSTQHNAQMLNSAATTSTCARILTVIGVKVPPASSTAPVLNNAGAAVTNPTQGATGSPAAGTTP